MNEADQPSVNEDPRPWEVSPHLRRDAEPHRSGLLFVLGFMALIFGALGVTLVFPILLALPLGVTVYVLAGRDLAQMKTGHRDLRGKAMAEHARFLGIAAVICCSLCPVFFALWFGWIRPY
jgi:hypothetical protein